jgi:DNA-binding transcriptional regulator YhcF (GntR family)
MQEIDKNGKATLSEQISKILVHEIRTGQLKPGSKLIGYRRLAKRFEVSWGTIIEALDRLENQNYIERISGRGTFINDDVNHELKTIKIAFLSSASSIALSSYGDIEAWRALSETYRGMVAEVSNNNAEVSFMHLDAASSEVQLGRQLRRLEYFDAAVFMGSAFTKLCDEFMNTDKPGVLIEVADIAEGNDLVVSDVNSAFKALARHAAHKKYQRLRILQSACTPASFFEQNKIQLAIKNFVDVGIAADENSIYPLQECTIDCLAAVLANNDFELKKGTDILYCPNASLVPILYRYCSENDIILGKDLGVFGYADGVLFANLTPAFTYSQINHFEKGQHACGRVIKAFRTGQLTHGAELIDNILIKGKSV